MHRDGVPTTWTLTFSTLGGVELLHRVVQPDADGGEAHLPLQPGRQPAVEAAGSLHPHHGAQRPQNTPVLHGADAPGDPHLTLDLRDANCVTLPSAHTSPKTPTSSGVELAGGGG